MVDLTKERAFQLWEYHVSHGSLLIRSPASPDIETSIDIICSGVEYIAAPRHLGKITLLEPTKDEIEHLEKILDKSLLPARIRVLQGSHSRFLLVAAGLIVREWRGDIFDSPFHATTA